MGMKGRCLCGAVRYVAESVDLDAHSCHCTMCTTWSGGPSLSLTAGSVRFEGEENIARYQSSTWAERGFCRVCGTNLFYKLQQPEQYMLCFGTLADKTQVRLASEIYVDEKPSTYAFVGDHPRMTGAEFLASIGMSPDT